ELRVERAIKLIAAGDEVRETLQRRLQAEARAMARLRHPNILAIHDVGSEGTLEYIVMDLVEGGSLMARLERDGYLPTGEAIRLVVQVLSALSVAHAAGVVHRDVKPHNVLIDRDGNALLADFGIALVEGDDRRTRAGVAMGSFAYMPHEQRIDAAKVGPAADLYAAGATLYHLVTGENPVDLFLATDPASPRWTVVPPLLRDVLRRACAANPEDRFPTAEAMATALAQLAPTEPPPGPRTVTARGDAERTTVERTIPDPPDRAGRRSRAMRWAAAVVVVVAVGSAVWATFPVARDLPQDAAPVPAPDAGSDRGRPVTGTIAGGQPPAPRVIPPPGPAPVPRPAPPLPAPAVARPPPFGQWSGSMNGVRFSLDLAGTPDAITGTASSRIDDKVRVEPVTGAFDPSSNRVVLAEGGEDPVTYELAIAGERLTGVVVMGADRRALSLKRVAP
ncbi:MAG: serine/threonine-protein kinase, partial [Myxococcota bacterium]